jgi:hypothetical protein
MKPCISHTHRLVNSAKKQLNHRALVRELRTKNRKQRRAQHLNLGIQTETQAVSGAPDPFAWDSLGSLRILCINLAHRSCSKMVWEKLCKCEICLPVIRCERGFW